MLWFRRSTAGSSSAYMMASTALMPRITSSPISTQLCSGSSRAYFGRTNTMAQSLPMTLPRNSIQNSLSLSHGTMVVAKEEGRVQLPFGEGGVTGQAGSGRRTTQGGSMHGIRKGWSLPGNRRSNQAGRARGAL